MINTNRSMSSLGNHETRLNKIRSRDDETIIDPLFRFDLVDATDNRHFLIKGMVSNSNDSGIVIPIRSRDADNNLTLDQLCIFDDWFLDLDAATVDLDTFTGGIVDGTSLTADTDYNIFGVYDPTKGPSTTFQGFIMTARPKTTGASVFSGGTTGSSTVFTVTAGHGNWFHVDQRIIARKGTALGDAFNQGIITAVTSTTITVQLDPTYTAGDENNATLTGGTIEIFATDKMAPYLQSTSEHSLYPGGGIEYGYCYLGQCQTDSSSNVSILRKRGETYWEFDTSALQIFSEDQTTGFTSPIDRCLGRWIPIGRQIDVVFEATIRQQTGTIVVNFQLNISPGNRDIPIERMFNSGVLTVFAVEGGALPAGPRFQEMRFAINNIPGAGNWTTASVYRGYLENEF